MAHIPIAPEKTAFLGRAAILTEIFRYFAG
jgi:hypothetical protein